MSEKDCKKKMSFFSNLFFSTTPSTEQQQQQQEVTTPLVNEMVQKEFHRLETTSLYEDKLESLNHLI